MIVQSLQSRNLIRASLTPGNGFTLEFSAFEPLRKTVFSRNHGPPLWPAFPRSGTSGDRSKFIKESL